MKNKKFGNYWLLCIVGVLAAASYPAYMLIKVSADMIKYGTVYAENYPKYIIPYTPIAISLIVGVLILPLVVKYTKKFTLLWGSGVSLAVFFASELLLERMITVTKTVTGLVSTLEGWQMAMCYISPDMFVERTWTEVNVLMGEYSPAFKLHFYFISVVLIISILNCVYGFAKMILTGDKARLRTLVLQSVASGAFLGMCIWACFTAFYRTGEITVSPLSAVLMCAFFLIFGLTVGIYVLSFTLNKKLLWSVIAPTVAAIITVTVMYIGEMVLLSGHLYRFGHGFLFDGLTGVVLAPIDIAVILLSGALTSLIANIVRKK